MSDFPLLDRILALWMKRRLITPEQAARVADALRGQVFSLAQQWEEKVLEKVRDVLGKAIAEGWSMKEFKDAAAETLSRFNDGNYAEVVFRTNVSNAAAAGRYEEMFAPEYVDEAPYWEFAAVTDARNDADDECPDTRCRWLNGKTFRKTDTAAQAFLPPLHFQCFPAGTPVRGRFDGGLKALYSGEVVEMVTRRGNRLAVTRNHPVATPHGLVPAYTLREGDALLCYPGGIEDRIDSDRANVAVSAVFDPDDSRLPVVRHYEQDGPSEIDKTLETLALMGDLRRTAPRATDDLYGDARAIDGDVEVVTLNGELLRHSGPERAERGSDLLLSAMHEAKALVSRARHLRHRVGGLFLPGSSLPGGTALAFDGGAVLLQRSPFDEFSFGAATRGDATIEKSRADRAACDPERIGDSLLRLPGLVAVDDVIHVESKLVRHLPVYDLQSPYGWILAGNIYASNCRCVTIERTEMELKGAVMSGADIPFSPVPGWGGNRLTSLLGGLL